MMEQLNVLIAGESWVTHSIHTKGFDSFTTTAYVEGVGPLRDALTAGGMIVEHLPNHLAPAHFPGSFDALARYHVIILSDIGTNTLLLSPETFDRGRASPNRLVLLREWVRAGGGLIMVGGYMSFQGIDGKARYAATPLADVLPVSLESNDDRVEAPEGHLPRVLLPDHPIARGLPTEWPKLLGYNRLHVKPGAELVASVGAANAVLLACAVQDSGRTVAFASDCGPHWCPPEFLAWSGYATLWQHMVRWAARRL
jgi:uncharacterized membrane protein